MNFSKIIFYFGLLNGAEAGFPFSQLMDLPNIESSRIPVPSSLESKIPGTIIIYTAILLHGNLVKISINVAV